MQKSQIRNQFSCENPVLLEKVFGSFLEMVALYYDDLFEILLDDLLQEEVQEMNKIERFKNEETTMGIEATRQKRRARKRHSSPTKSGLGKSPTKSNFKSPSATNLDPGRLEEKSDVRWEGLMNLDLNQELGQGESDGQLSMITKQQFVSSKSEF